MGYTSGMDYETMTGIAIPVTMGKTVTGEAFSVGLYDGPKYLFAVRAIEHGCPVVLATDAWYAAEQFHRMEENPGSADPANVVRQPSHETEVAELRARFHARQPDVFPMLDAWLSYHREVVIPETRRQRARILGAMLARAGR